MVIKPNNNGKYTLYCCNGSYFTGTYLECEIVAERIIRGDVSVLSIMNN